ncbi:MAG: J domain-containing protein [Deltaproteobacteria bacterium]
MRHNKWKELDEARRILSLPIEVTRREIREAYRQKSRELHPDHCGADGPSPDMTSINNAYRLLMEYADTYTIKLAKNTDGMTDEEWWMDHFGQDPVWTPS